MLVVNFAAAAFDTNCYVVANGPGMECVVIDPGVGVVDVLEQVFHHYRLKPAHVLLTHAHSDHVYSATPVCGAHGIATTMHAADRYRLKDPLADLEPELLAMLESNFGSRSSWREPDDVVVFEDAGTLQLAGIEFDVTHAPGHTEGSVLYRVVDVPEGTPEDQTHTQTVFAGDVIVAGGIGRSDLPGGSRKAMIKTLRNKVWPLPDTTLLLPGHGQMTDMATERQGNVGLRSANADTAGHS